MYHHTRHHALRLVVLTLATVAMLPLQSWSAMNTLVRDSIPEQYKWDLTPIYSDWTAWESDLQKATGLVDSISTLKGYPSQGATQLLTFLRFNDRVGMTVDRLSVYADLQYCIDFGDNEVAARNQRIASLESSLTEARSWLQPELLKLGMEKVEGWFKAEPGLELYRFKLENLFRMKDHYLDEGQEKLLSYFEPFANSPDAVYSDFVYSDIQYPNFVRDNGDSLLLSESQVWYQMRVNPDQDERHRMFTAFYEAYDSYVNTYSSIYNSVLQRDWSEARARNYSSCLEAALNPDNVPVDVYQNLIKIVREQTEPLQRYHRLRKKALGLDHYFWSDRQSPLVDFHRTYEYDEIVPWVLDAVAPLGPEYIADLRDLIGSRRVDVYENEGKYTGAFENDAYGTPEYILMNFNGTLEEIFTLAHEAGHAMHSHYSNANQSYTNAMYTIFVAEVPSTLNEALLLNYLLERTDDPKERIAVLQQAIENIVGTFYLQTMFADFELQTHELVEQGEPVTADALRGIYAGLLSDYFGDAIEIDSLYYSYWTRIGHFFESPFYVYKYATSFASSAKLVQGILSDDKATREKSLRDYHGLLSAGGSDYPMEELKTYGVDPSSPDVIGAVPEELDRLVTRLEEELNRL